MLKLLLLVCLLGLGTCAVLSTLCPNIVYCFVAPCQVTRCAAHPNATCRDNYCGGCNAEFYDANGNRYLDCP